MTPVAKTRRSFPSRDVEPLPQSYRREAERSYRYASDEGRFIRNQLVSPAGLVTTYSGLRRAEPSAEGDAER